MVLIIVLIASLVFLYFFKPWIALPMILLTLVTIRAIQLRNFARGLVESGRFFASIILICLGYFNPLPISPEHELLLRFPTIGFGAFGFWYYAPTVGMTRLWGFIIPFLCVVIPFSGFFLGFSPFELR